MSSIRVLIFSAFTLALLNPAFGQQDNKELAKQYMEQAELILEATKALDDARDNMVTAADLDTTLLKANYGAAHLHLITINKNLAVKYLMRVYRQDPNYRFDLEYWIGKSYQYGLEFDKAIDFYNRYKRKLQQKSNYQGKDKVAVTTVDRAIFECENGKNFVSNPKNFSIVNIGREINSEYDDYAPVFNEAGTEIVFTTRRKDGNLNENVADDNKPWEDIFYATKSGKNWNYAKNIAAPVNSPTHDSNLAMSADGSLLFKYTDNNGGDIYYSERQADGTWSMPIPLPGIINSSYEEKSISISKDEKTLYFSSNRPGGFGGLDIYKATKDTKGNWTYVKNLGPKINTEFDDDGPFIDYDGVTLYFSSKGHKGMGGHDIFKATALNNNDWSDPENLGYPINTPDDDVFFISSPDGKTAYYSSLRDDGMGYQDIYIITIPDGLKNTEPVSAKESTSEKKNEVTTASNNQTPAKTEPVKTEPLKIEPAKTDPVKTEPIKTEPKVEPTNTVAKDEPKTQPVNTEPKNTTAPKAEPQKTQPATEPQKALIPMKYVVTVVDAEGHPVSAKVRMQGLKDNVIVKSTTPQSGTYEFSVTSKTPKDYRLSIEADGFVFVNENVKLGGAATEEKVQGRTIQMRKLTVGVTSILRNIYFDFDKATFKTESYGELNKLEAMLRQNSNVMVEIGGHTDGVGSVAYNTFLSRKRAEAVKDFLVKKGIDARRVKAVGYGKTKPLASNDDEEEGRELNRRVEFKVLSN
ncbi:OmpA family protein [Chryseosolibacter indicus]|uniref:OmpA family protein n=1 Tax=Chryseosolibacter indicus TaxID=2782351 RepID=A0ABS5VMW3_9BACT|nr:OmpA family protein [Chryseosolibacter indicus]MBT1702790.1 OmpA family protein [Chryseosolibacter indicus]